MRAARGNQTLVECRSLDTEPVNGFQLFGTAPGELVGYYTERKILDE